MPHAPRDTSQVDDSAVFRTRLHPVSVLAGLFGAALTLLFTGLIVRNNGLAGAPGIKTAMGGLVVALLWVLGPVCRFLRSEVRVGSDSVVAQTTAFQSPRMARLADIDEVVAQAGAVGRYLGYGTVALYGGDGTAATVRHVQNADGLRDAIVRQRRRCLKRDAGSAA